MITPQQAATNWAAGMSAAGAKAKAGVQAVTESPASRAILAIPRQVQGVIDAANSGRTQAGLQTVTLQSWQNAYINKGLPRMASGAQDAKPKMANFMTQFLPFVANNVAQLPPRGDLQTNIQRAVAMMNLNAGFKYQKISQ